MRSPDAASERPLSDEELLALLQEVEDAEARAEDAVEASALEAAAAPEPELDGEPCPGCGEVAQDLERCCACGMQGCLPRDDWAPGIADNCLTRCERCAMLVHRYCATQPDDDFNPNPRCPACAGRY